MFPGAPGVGEGGVSSGSAARETPGPPSCASQSRLRAARSLALWDGGQLRGEGHVPPPAQETHCLLSGPGVVTLGLRLSAPRAQFYSQTGFWSNLHQMELCDLGQWLNLPESSAQPLGS